MATVLTPPAPAPLALPEAPRTASRRPQRDVFVDAVRALGTLGVVTLHWTMADATWDGRTLRLGNAVGHQNAWVLTWVLQVLPLLFFAAGAGAGFQHLAAEGSPTAAPWVTTLGRRLRGVVRPVAVFAAAWAVGATVLIAVGVPAGAVRQLARMAPQPLWFLVVWLALTALVPPLLAAWRRWRWRALAVAVAAPLAVDVLRFALGVGSVAWVNVLLVWAVPFLAGLAYADQRRAGRRPVRSPVPSPVLWTGLGLGIAAMVVLVTVGPYPRSMVGMPGDAISNLSPPTAPVVAQAVAQLCAILLARPLVERWADGAGRRTVGLLRRRSMTVYVWHLTAMFVVVGLDLVVLHERLPEPWGTDWWTSRPVWFTAYGLVLTGLVLTFGRFEPSRSAPGSRR